MNKDITPIIIGIDGLLGNALWRYFRTKNPKTYGTSKRGTDGLPVFHLEDGNLNQLRLDLTPFTHAIIAAAQSNIKTCETSPATTRLSNVKGIIRIAQQFAALKIQPVLFSSDYVFNGTQGGYDEQSPLSPVNEYGKQKAELEQNIPKVTLGNYLILRLAKVFIKSLCGKGLLGEIADNLRNHQTILAARDLVFSPVLLEDVIQGIEALLHFKKTGLFNLGGSEIWNRYDLTLAIAKTIRADPKWIVPISIADLKENFQRPKKTNLISDKLIQTTGIKITPLSLCIKN